MLCAQSSNVVGFQACPPAKTIRNLRLEFIEEAGVPTGSFEGLEWCVDRECLREKVRSKLLNVSPCPGDSLSPPGQRGEDFGIAVIKHTACNHADAGIGGRVFR